MDNSLLDPGNPANPLILPRYCSLQTMGMKVGAANEKSTYALCLPLMIISNDHILAENMQC
ncbi:hypothetical protein T06_7641 [Trichinella sp. T6]|nr:hypothetical protein T06_7641 [Trichinella sp. T6]